MSEQSVLYDAQGPRARRRTRIGTAVALLALAGLVFVVVRRLADQDQFTMEKWGPLIDPGNESFDAVLSTFGVMFAPNQEKAAAELLRVCRPGGKIGLTNWTPEGAAGQMFRTIGKHVPPPPGLRPPPEWGTEARLRELFGSDIAGIEVSRRHLMFRYPSADVWLEVFRTYFGPVSRAFDAVGPAGEAALREDLLQLLARFNRSGDQTILAPSEYLEVVATKR